jgi:hypothetical protein
MNETFDLKTLGDEYPQAVTLNGIRMTLVRETEFSRRYATADKKRYFSISRFMDGSASISLLEVEAGWPSWSGTQRLDFCGACSALTGQNDFPDILRFVVRDADVTLVSAIANKVAHSLPRDEAFEFLRTALRTADGDGTANITQALARTGHPEAKALLLAHLTRLWTAADRLTPAKATANRAPPIFGDTTAGCLNGRNGGNRRRQDPGGAQGGRDRAGAEAVPRASSIRHLDIELR